MIRRLIRWALTGRLDVLHDRYCPCTLHLWDDEAEL